MCSAFRKYGFKDDDSHDDVISLLFFTGILMKLGYTKYVLH